MNFITEEKYEELISKFTKYVICKRNDSNDFDRFTVQLDEIGFFKSRLQYEVGTAELLLKDEEAKAYLDIKNNPDKYNLNKTSEAALKILIEAHSKVIEAKKQYLLSTYYADRANSLYSAMFAKKSWLEITERASNISIKNS